MFFVLSIAVFISYFLGFIELLTNDKQVAGTSAVTFVPVTTSSYIENPGIGWQYMEGSDTNIMPETVAYFERSDISWKLIHTAENTYNWSLIDNRINAAVAQGKQASFRVYTHRGEGFGGHQVPQWAVDKGIFFTNAGDPNYTGCVYQEEWGKFVNALRTKYDGNPNIAYIDISGYGNFNEWSWVNQTQFDDTYVPAAEKYFAGTGAKPTRAQITGLDGQARARLVDIFAGGTYNNHKCKNADGTTSTVTYSYPSFNNTQLIMPYAGIRQSIYYTYIDKPHVGFRHDCLGRVGSAVSDLTKIDTILKNLWRTQPVVYELCAIDWTDSQFVNRADQLLKYSHGSMVHDNPNGSVEPATTMQNLMKYAGYRYVMSQITYDSQTNAGGNIQLAMKWQNVGYAPNYPKMGQKFKLYAYLTNQADQVAASFPINVNIANWLPADPLPGIAPTYNVNQTIDVPNNLPVGTYKLKVGILDERTNKNIKLAIQGNDSNNRYYIGNVNVGSGQVQEAVCGNSALEYGEICDDGNTVNDDQCSSDCKNSCTSPNTWDGSKCKNTTGGNNSPTCGNGVLEQGEACDDGNNQNGDLCSADCKIVCKTIGGRTNCLNLGDKQVTK